MRLWKASGSDFRGFEIALFLRDSVSLWSIGFPRMSECIDPVVGKILAGWRYDISGLAPEMCGDYEQHFAACERCRSRQRLHRVIDLSLIVLASVSAGVFLLAFGIIH